MWLLDKTWVVSNSCNCETLRMYLLFSMYMICIMFVLRFSFFVTIRYSVTNVVKFENHVGI